MTTTKLGELGRTRGRLVLGISSAEIAIRERLRALRRLDPTLHPQRHARVTEQIEDARAILTSHREELSRFDAEHGIGQP